MLITAPIRVELMSSDPNSEILPLNDEAFNNYLPSISCGNKYLSYSPSLTSESGI